MIRPPIKIKSLTSARKFISKASWECIGGHKIYFRSQWEVKVATYLQTLQNSLQINSWEYEPQTFWFLEIKRGCRSYKPDFKITKLDGSHYWIEVKGYMDRESKTKLKRFSKYYPEEKLVLITKDSFIKNSILVSLL